MVRGPEDGEGETVLRYVSLKICDTYLKQLLIIQNIFYEESYSCFLHFFGKQFDGSCALFPSV